jgi:hypothetical protein
MTVCFADNNPEQTILEVKRRYGGYAVPLAWGRMHKEITTHTEKSSGTFTVPQGQ